MFRHQSPYPGPLPRGNLVLTIQGEGLISEGRYQLNRIYDLGINASRNFYTPYAQFTGTVTSIG